MQNKLTKITFTTKLFKICDT